MPCGGHDGESTSEVIPSPCATESSGNLIAHQGLRWNPSKQADIYNASEELVTGASGSCF